MQQSPTMPTIVETRPSQGDSDTSVAANLWSPPDGYQSSISTLRNADAARDAKEKTNEPLSEGNWEFWRIHIENFS